MPTRSSAARARDPHHSRGGQGTTAGQGDYRRKAVGHDDAFDVARGKDVEIVVELIGGYTVAKELVLEAIAHGKHVVTANKALLATHGNEIFAAAQKKGVMVAFEASVGGGIPIIKALREGLARTASSGSPASSTAPPTSSSRRCATRACRSRRR
jgi:homoserine dehydrogenase